MKRNATVTLSATETMQAFREYIERHDPRGVPDHESMGAQRVSDQTGIAQVEVIFFQEDAETSGGPRLRGPEDD